MFKLRFYVTSGPNKGDFDHEEKFHHIYDLIERYQEVFTKYSSTNPTAWMHTETEYGWVRVPGF